MKYLAQTTEKICLCRVRSRSDARFADSGFLISGELVCNCCPLSKKQSTLGATNTRDSCGALVPAVLLSHAKDGRRLRTAGYPWDLRPSGCQDVDCGAAQTARLLAILIQGNQAQFWRP